MSRILSLRLIHAMHALTSRNLTINPQTILSVLASVFFANHLAVVMTTSHSTPSRQLLAAGGGGGRRLK